MGMGRRLAAFTGYLLYALCLAAVLIWYLFPVDAARKRLEFELGRITPELEWKVAGLGPALPASIRARGLSAFAMGGKTELFSIDALTLTPTGLLAALRNHDSLGAGYRLDLLGGTVRGKIAQAEGGASLRFDGTVAGVDLALGKGLQRLLKRRIGGKLSGSFKGSWKEGKKGGLAIQGKVLVEKGEFAFQQPVLGMKELKFSRMDTGFARKAGAAEILLTDGTMEATLLKILFSGGIRPQSPVERSVLRLEGTMIPRPEFLAKVGDAVMIKMLKKELQDGRLSFKVNGSLNEPAIFFPGLPSGLEKYLHEGDR